MLRRLQVGTVRSSFRQIAQLETKSLERYPSRHGLGGVRLTFGGTGSSIKRHILCWLVLRTLSPANSSHVYRQLASGERTEKEKNTTRNSAAQSSRIEDGPTVQAGLKRPRISQCPIIQHYGGMSFLENQLCTAFHLTFQMHPKSVESDESEDRQFINISRSIAQCAVISLLSCRPAGRASYVTSYLTGEIWATHKTSWPLSMLIANTDDLFRQPYGTVLHHFCIGQCPYEYMIYTLPSPPSIGSRRYYLRRSRRTFRVLVGLLFAYVGAR